ncbi:NAD(P)-dependent oxidoreductase, partial [Pantoea sp. B9002]|nr:NAD(P)-dependent oxidoreductase [Pantoea sp. B9002]
MSKIAIIGATGRAGSQLLEEALRRGHGVTA